MRQCVFCENKANSREHIIPGWILNQLGDGKGPFHLTLGKKPTVPLATPERKAKVVCSTCNQGWMHKLEDTVKPIISPPLHDISLRLDIAQQHTAAKWAVKTAIIHNAAVRDSPNCLSRTACEQLRAHIPRGTAVWLGRFSHPGAIASTGLDVWLGIGNVPEAVHVHITTVVVGHLAIQVNLSSVRPEYRDASIPLYPKPGPWDKILVPIWPASENIVWPPPLTFRRDDLGGLSIGRLFDRWRTGDPR